VAYVAGFVSLKEIEPELVKARVFRPWAIKVMTSTNRVWGLVVRGWESIRCSRLSKRRGAGSSCIGFYRVRTVSDADPTSVILQNLRDFRNESLKKRTSIGDGMEEITEEFSTYTWILEISPFCLAIALLKLSHRYLSTKLFQIKHPVIRKYGVVGESSYGFRFFLLIKT
jgi:hypothetical protein